MNTINLSANQTESLKIINHLQTQYIGICQAHSMNQYEKQPKSIAELNLPINLLNMIRHKT
jgi:hypothetical protein